MEANYSVFLSYSHEDESVVSGLKPLLEIQRKDLIFQDKTELKPGNKWEDILLNALDDSKAVVVFWCSHSSASAYVKKEFERGYAQNKEIIPVILDDTPLLSPLDQFQGIDLRRLVKHKPIASQDRAPASKSVEHQTNTQVKIPTTKQSAFRWLFLLSGIAIFIVACMVYVAGTMQGSMLFTIAVICAFIALIAALILPRFRRSAKPTTLNVPVPPSSPVPSIPPLGNEVINPFNFGAADEIIKQLNKRIPVQSNL